MTWGSLLASGEHAVRSEHYGSCYSTATHCPLPTSKVKDLAPNDAIPGERQSELDEEVELLELELLELESELDELLDESDELLLELESELDELPEDFDVPRLSFL